MILPRGIVVVSSVGAFVAQVTMLMDVKSVFLPRAAVEAFQTHLYRYVASLLHSS